MVVVRSTRLVDRGVPIAPEGDSVPRPHHGHVEVKRFKRLLPCSFVARRHAEVDDVKLRVGQLDRFVHPTVASPYVVL